jgi:Xaa-Pro aminopeptidase
VETVATRRPGDENVLIIADSESDADLFYATRFLVGDPVIYLEVERRKVLLVSDLEYGRARRQADVDDVVSTHAFEEELRRAGEIPRLAKLVDLYLRGRGVRQFVVPSSFALGHAEQLRQSSYTLTCREDPFFPERTLKTDAEIAAIARSQEAAEECMAFIVEAIRRSRIQGELLYRNGVPLTADWLRVEAQKLLLEKGYLAAQTIIAGGDQGCDPHVRGSGPLPAHQTIVIDIFPRSLQTRYWGDITRTVVRGAASPQVRRLYTDVLDAQETAIRMLRDGVDGQQVHQAVMELFQSRGNETEERDGRKTGFIHSTGHGVGLSIHEPPKIGKVECKLQARQAVTVEPGLYYPGVGAVRLEDMVVVTKEGSANLTRFAKELEC